MNAQPEQLSFPSEPIVGETAATVGLVGSDWRADEDWQRFEAACRLAASTRYHDGYGEWDTSGFVDPNSVRRQLTNSHGLTIEPRRYSAFWHRAARGKDAFLVADGWVLNTDHAGGNAGKPLRRYRLRGDA